MQKDQKSNASISRRQFIAGMSATVAGAGATLSALSPLIHAKETPSVKEILQKHYKKLTPEDKKIIFDRLEKNIASEYGIKTAIHDPQPLSEVTFGYALNIGRCIGCRKCAYGCMKENNLSLDPQIQYIRVLKMPKGTIDLESAVHDYPEEDAGNPDRKSVV